MMTSPVETSASSVLKEETPAFESSSFGMTDLEDQLLSEDGKKIQQGLLKRLGELDLEVTLQMSDGPSPDIFQGLKKIKRALAASEDLVVSYPCG